MISATLCPILKKLFQHEYDVCVLAIKGNLGEAKSLYQVTSAFGQYRSILKSVMDDPNNIPSLRGYDFYAQTTWFKIDCEMPITGFWEDPNFYSLRRM
jgi:hypothetical protein